MRYNKQPISIPEQIALLKRRGMAFSNEHEAVSILENISYFRLAGYWRTMEQSNTHHLFRADSKFEDMQDFGILTSRSYRECMNG